MDITASLAADLGDLTAALDQPGAGLESALRDLGCDVRVAVGSFLGLSLTIVTDDGPFTFTVTEPLASQEAVRASLLLPLSVLAAALDAGSRLVLFAARAGAFVDLAADLAFTLELDPLSLRVDEDLVLPDPGVPTGLSDIAVVNQAIGVLIDRGNTPDQARAELRRGAGGRSGVVASAHRVIASIPRPPAGAG